VPIFPFSDCAFVHAELVGEHLLGAAAVDSDLGQAAANGGIDGPFWSPHLVVFAGLPKSTSSN
jgi:hypothetical protein